MDNVLNISNLGAVDALSRKLSEIRGFRKDRFVGLFYWTWHNVNVRNKSVINLTDFTQEHPEAINDYEYPLWGNPREHAHYWGEPIYGYYDDCDELVVRRNAELIANAGVDVIVFDCTNGNYLWDSEYKFLAEVYKKAIKDGVSVPKMAFMLNFCALPETRDMLHRIYDEFYSKKENEQLFFYWEGKPLVMAHPECLDVNNPKEKEIFEFFTFRHNEPTYFAADTSYDAEKKFWGWCSVYPQTKYGVKKDGRIEQMCVSVAQNADDTGLVAMNHNGGKGVYGRNYAKGDYSYNYDRYGETVNVSENTDKLYLYGRNFQQQWDYAIKNDPDFIFVTGWNEQIVGRFKNWEGTPNAFPDQFDYEHSRDCEPTKTMLGDCYYYQLCENIRRYKGLAGKTPETVEFYAYGGYDITKTTVKTDSNVEIYAETADKRFNFENTMLLISTADANDKNSWEGFDYIVKLSENGTAKLLKSNGGFDFTEIADVTLIKGEKSFTLDIPLELKHFGFKWMINTCMTGDMMDSYAKGQAIPNGRFYYTV